MKLLIRGKRKGREITKNLIDQHCHCLLKYLNKQDFVRNIIKGAHFLWSKLTFSWILEMHLTGIENYSVCSKGTQNTQSSNFSFQVGAKLGQNSDTACIIVLKFKFVKLIISIFECKVWFCLNNLCREYA